jgi:hypothetical protein
MPIPLTEGMPIPQIEFPNPILCNTEPNTTVVTITYLLEILMDGETSLVHEYGLIPGAKEAR